MTFPISLLSSCPYYGGRPNEGSLLSLGARELSVIERCHYSGRTCKTLGVFGTNTGTVHLQGVSIIAVRNARSLVTREHSSPSVIEVSL